MRPNNQTTEFGRGEDYRIIGCGIHAAVAALGICASGKASLEPYPIDSVPATIAVLAFNRLPAFLCPK
jgi:hypothetical protein